MGETLTRSASLTGFADLARSVGLDPHRLRAEQGLPAACLDNPDLWIPAAAVGRLLERAAAASGAHDFGLRLAETRRLSNLGAVAFVVREQPTLRQALNALVSYASVQNQALVLRLEVRKQFAVLYESLVGPNGRSLRQARDLTLGVTTLMIRRLVGQSWRPRDVCFSHERPVSIATHRRVFGVAPLFDQDFDGIVFELRDLDVRIADADPIAARRAQRYLDLEVGFNRDDPTAMVRELIAALLPTGICTIDEVAAHLGINRRTLHRRLAAAGATTFTRLLEETRVSLARRFLDAGHLSMTEIAERLGYSSLSAFSRWRRHALSKSNWR